MIKTKGNWGEKMREVKNGRAQKEREEEEEEQERKK